MNPSGPVTLLFTDLVDSTELLQRAGDERAQRIFRAHHKLLKTAVAVHGGQEVKWLGDGLLTAFASTADAVRCAVATQQAARRRAAGGRLAIRIGLHVSEALRDETDYFGTPVVIARRLCDRAKAGQILCSSLVAGILAGRHAFVFRDYGALELQGIATPLGASEVLYQQEGPGALLTHTPFVGRAAELRRLTRKLLEMRAGHGGLIMLAGEPGIGKTRTMEEFAETAREHGALVVAGRCYEGEWAPPYGPFGEALAECARSAGPEQLRTELGYGAAPLAPLVPVLRETLPDIPAPVALQPDEERFRLLDAVAQYLIAVSARLPLVLVLDDLHWADQGTIAMLRHVARFASRHHILLLGGYRDVEVERTHHLAEALGTLPRETSYEPLVLKGLAREEVQELLDTIADQSVPEALVQAISAETSGNPFFIREVLLHLVEEGAIDRRGGRWSSDFAMTDKGIPESVRQVVARRLGRLSAETNRLLSVGSAFTGPVHIRIAARVAGLHETRALDAVDEALAAQLLAPASDADACAFTHALIRHTLYGALTPPRQARLHRQIAEAMEAFYGGRASEHAALIAEQYHRSAALPGAERGVEHCLTAATRAEKAAAHGEAASFLQMALQLLPANDTRRPRILGRHALALAWSLMLDEAVRGASEASDLIAASEGDDAASDYLAEAAEAVWAAGFSPGAWPLAEHGLRRIGSRRDVTWARLMSHVVAQADAADPNKPRVAMYTDERRIMADILYAARHQLWVSGRVATPALDVPFRSRADAVSRAADDPFAMAFWVGDYRAALRLSEGRVKQALERGQIGLVAQELNIIARVYTALGDLSASLEARDRAAELMERLGNPPFLALQVGGATMEHVFVRGEGYELMLASAEALLEHSAPENQFAVAVLRVACALSAAELGHRDEALRWLATVMPTIDSAPGWTPNYTLLVGMAARVSWAASCADPAPVIQRNIRDKTLAPDFRQPHCDARLAMGQLCALQAHWSDAIRWFAKAREVLDEQDALPVRALVDCDEALMYLRRGQPGDSERAAALLEIAEQQFRAIGMTGWLKRAEELQARHAAQGSLQQTAALSAAESVGSAPASTTLAPERNLFRREGDYWTVAFDGRTIHLKDSKGLHYLAHLLRHPAREFHVLDLATEGAGGVPEQRRGRRGGQPRLDVRAKATYKHRLDELRDELVEAEGNSDIGRAAKAREEMERITEQLAAAVGLGGRDRPVGADPERARLTVTKGIKATLDKIRASHPMLARHLAATIKTGYFCSYTPDPQGPVAWQ